MKKAIILGANGFLGKNLTHYLVKMGVEVCAMVQVHSDYEEIKNLHQVEIIEFELDSIQQYENRISKDYDVLYHLAWVGVCSSAKNDFYVQSKNILHNISVLDFAKKINVGKVIFPGTASEFSCSNEIITGNNIPAPSDMYSTIKLSVRYISQMYAKQIGIPVIWTFIGSVYGPGRNDNNLITYTIKSLLSNKTPQYTKLEQKWDYIYIKDLVKALFLIALYGKNGTSYPIGSGSNRSLLDYVLTIKNMIDSSSSIEIGKIPYKNSVLDNQIIDIKTLKEDTGFSPEYTFKEGIEETIEYYKNFNNV